MSLKTISILPANRRYRLAEKANPHLVENCGASGRSSLAAFKLRVQEDVVSRAEPVKQIGLNYPALLLPDNAWIHCLAHTLNESALFLPLVPHFPPFEDFNSPERLSSM